MWFAFAAITASFLSGYQQAEGARADAEYRANVAGANAAAKREQAEITRRQTEIDLRSKGIEQQRLKRQYRSMAGTNTSILAAGNLDVSSGSALDLLEGNANLFADDMGELEFEKSQIAWSGEREAQLQEWEADVFDSRESYLSKSAGSTGKSLLSGVVGGVGTYAMLR